MSVNEIKAKIESVQSEFKMWNLNSIMSENLIKSNEQTIKNKTKLYNDVIDKLNKAIERAVRNSKLSHDKLDECIKTKERLHKELKEALHIGETECEFCHNYYTPQGYSRHKTNCSMKPSVKEVKQNEKDVKVNKAALLKKKKELDKQIAALKKSSE